MSTLAITAIRITILYTSLAAVYLMAAKGKG